MENKILILKSLFSMHNQDDEDDLKMINFELQMILLIHSQNTLFNKVGVLLFYNTGWRSLNRNTACRKEHPNPTFSS